MTAELEEALDRLAEAIDRERPGAVQAAAEAIREELAMLLAEVRLEPEDPLLAERRRLHHRLEVVEAKAQAGRFEDAEEDREEVAPIARDLAQALDAREPPGANNVALPGPRRAWVLAKREARATWRRVLVVAALALLVVALAAEGGAGAATSLLALASLGGAVAAAGTLGDDARAGRLHLVVGHGSSRAGLVAAKLAAVVGLLALGLLAAALLGGLAGRALGVGVELATVAVWGLVLAGLSAAFASIVAALEAEGLDTRSALAAAALAYVVLGPVWRSAFLAGSGTGGGLASTGAHAVYLASPVAAGRHVLEVADPVAGALPGALVLIAWILVAASAGALLAQRQGFPVPTRDHN